MVGSGAEVYGTSSSHESDESNLVQGAVAAVASFDTGDDGLTEPSQAYWSPLPSNGSLETEHSSTTAVGTVSDEMYEEVSVVETTGFGGQFPAYATDMSEDIITTAQSEDEATRLEYSDTTMSEEGTTGTTITETSVTVSATHRQDESSSTDSDEKPFGDNGTSDISGTSNLGDESTTASSSKLRPIQSRDGFDGPLMVVLTDRGIVEVRPSAVRAETEIVVHGDDVKHRNIEVQNRDDAVAQTTYHTSESSGDFETWPTGGAGDHEDTATEAYPEITVTETDSAGTGTVVTSALQSVPEDTALPATGTAVSSGDTTLLQDFSQNSVVRSNKLSGSQRMTSNSVPGAELDNSHLFTATETLIPTAQDSAVSKSENIEHIVSESVSTEDRRVSGEELRTVTEGNKLILTQILYADGLQLAPGTQSPLAESESELSKNALQISEISNEIPVTIRTEMSLDEIMTSPGQTLTLSWKHDDTETEHTTQILSEPSLRDSDRVSVLSEQDRSGECDENAASTATGADDVGTEPTSRAECVTAVSLQPSALEAEGESVHTEDFSASQTFDGHLNTQGTQTFAEITTLLPNMETTVSGSEPTAEQPNQLRSGAHSGNQQDSAFLNDAENVPYPIAPSTIVDTEILVAFEGTTVGNSSPHGAAGTANRSTPPSTAPSSGAATQQTAHHSPLCGGVTSGRSRGTQCWLVQFVKANSSSPVCVGSYLDATTIVTSATCISRSEELGSNVLAAQSIKAAVS
jgi:hypothetical protein